MPMVENAANGPVYGMMFPIRISPSVVPASSVSSASAAPQRWASTATSGSTELCFKLIRIGRPHAKRGKSDIDCRDRLLARSYSQI